MNKLLTLILIFFTTISYASNFNSTIKLVEKNSKVVMVEIDKFNFEGSITIQGLDNSFYYSEKIVNVDPFSKKFNLNNLKIGTYSIQVKSNESITTHKLSVNQNTVILNETNNYFKPFIQVNKNLMKLVFLGDLTQKAKVKIFNQRGEKIYDLNKSLKDLNNINFKFIDLGNYNIIITMAEISFEESVKI